MKKMSGLTVKNNELANSKKEVTEVQNYDYNTIMSKVD